ncbi:MAG: hypothetical protein QXT33_03740 [Thermofilum sp.]
MPVRAVLVPLASRLHGEEYYSKLLAALRTAFGSAVEEVDVVTSVEEARRAGSSAAGGLPILLFLTGGTSKLAQEFVSAGCFAAVAMLAHGEHNSLASAISARYKLEARGVRVWLSPCYSPWSGDCAERGRRLARAVLAAAKLHGVRVAVIQDALPPQAEALERRLGARVELITQSEFERMVEQADEAVSRALAKEVGEAFGVSGEKLLEVGRVYAALRELFGRFDAVAIDCFDYLAKRGVTPCLALAKLNAEGLVTACEADLQAVLLMLVSRELTGYAGWIANATAFSGTRGVFSHCTIAFNMVESGRVLPHFESGYPHALSGKLAHSTYTIASISPDFAVLGAGLAKVVESGLLSGAACRTQALVELGPWAEELPRAAPANHHVFIPGDVVEELRAVAKLLGLRYLHYPSLA